MGVGWAGSFIRLAKSSLDEKAMGHVSDDVFSVISYLNTWKSAITGSVSMAIEIFCRASLCFPIRFNCIASRLLS